MGRAGRHRKEGINRHSEDKSRFPILGEVNYKNGKKLE